MSWQERVGSVFDLGPRNGVTHAHWLLRDEEKRMLEAVTHPRRHVCLDGPSGTGKSSLAATACSKAEVPYRLVRVSDGMTWSEFCRALVEPQDRSDSQSEIPTVGNLAHRQSAFAGQASLGIVPENGISPQDIAENWSVADACSAMLKAQVSLMIDDLDRAEPDSRLVTNISDLAKELIQRGSGDGTKLIIVGTDDVYWKIISEAPALKRRMSIVTLGTFSNSHASGMSWAYLVQGFSKLGFKYFPGSPAQKDLHAKRGTSELFQQELLDCQTAVAQAADGLPKTLTELGERTAIAVGDRARTIKPQRLLDAAAEIFQSEVELFKEAFPGLRKKLKSSETTRVVLTHLLSQDTGAIVSLNRTITEFAGRLSEKTVRETVDELVRQKLLVRTGPQLSRLFFSDVELSHTLSVLASNPELCLQVGIDPQVFRSVWQLEFDWDL